MGSECVATLLFLGFFVVVVNSGSLYSFIKVILNLNPSDYNFNNFLPISW